MQRHPLQNEALMLVTTNVRDRMPIFAHAAYAREAVETLYRVQGLHPFLLFGFVIMPDHCHFLLWVPAPESIAKVMNVYKSGVTFNIGLPRLWQARFHIRVPDHPEEALRYIHQNPVRAELASQAEDYPWSSASGQWKTASLEEETYASIVSAATKGCTE